MTHAERVADPPVTREPGSTPADFDAFFAATYDRLVRALAVTVGDVHLGADCIQEAMVRAYLRWDDVGGYANREGWDREVLVLRFLLDWSVEATAEVLGIAPGTVKSRTARALESLRDDLEADDVDRHPTA